MFLPCFLKECAVPKTYPVDEELIKLCTINHVERLGLSEYFMLEKEKALEEAYKYIILHNHMLTC